MENRMVTFETSEKIQKSKMNYKEAIDIVGSNRAKWELKNMKKALSFAPLLNSVEDEKRLKAIKVILIERRKKKK